MRSGAFQAGVVFTALIAVTFIALEGSRLGQATGYIEGDPVLVFVIPEAESTRRVRAAVSPERIVWEGPAGLALVGGRVIASNHDDAGDVIERAGWLDRPIQIVQLSVTPVYHRDQDTRDPSSDEARLARLRELVHKPTLTRGEQLFVLMAMNDGLEI